MFINPICLNAVTSVLKLLTETMITVSINPMGLTIINVQSTPFLLNLLRRYQSAACRQSLCHKMFFSLLKTPILSHKSLRMGVQPEHKHFNKTLLLLDCMNHSRHKDCMADVTYSLSIPVLHAENSVPTLFFSVRLYSRKLSDT